MRVHIMSVCLLLTAASLHSCGIIGGSGSDSSSSGDVNGKPKIPSPVPTRGDTDAPDTTIPDFSLVPGQGGMTFVKLPSGTFIMGHPVYETGRCNDGCPQHQVTISKAFEMQTTEVTQSQWVSVMGSNPSYFKKRGTCPDEFSTVNNISMCPNNPVEGVSWYDAQEFISKLNAKGDGYRYRLPTEAEWEYAARAGTTGAYAGDIDAMAWHASNSGSISHPVAKKQANAWGLFDMAGNVCEWTSDWYGPYSASPVTDPTGPSSGIARVVRGGSWGLTAPYLSSDYRGLENPGNQGIVTGFRILRTSP